MSRDDTMRPVWGTTGVVLCLGVLALLMTGTGVWAGEVFRPGKGWQPAEPGEQTTPDLSTESGQLAHAQVLWEAGKLKRCQEMCREIIRRYKTGPTAEEAYVLLVKTEAALGDLKSAEADAKRFHKQFPGSPSESLMADAEMDILERRAQQGDTKTLRRLEQMVEANPYGARADRAQLLVGDIYLKQRRYSQARDAYDMLLNAYPRSRYLVQAEFGKGKATYLANQGVMRDAGFYIEAEQILKGVLESEPDFAAKAEVEGYLKRIHKLLAERQFRVGRYYEGQRRARAAEVYYRDVIKRFGDTGWAGKAQNQLKKLGLPEIPAETASKEPGRMEGATVEKTP